jgi:hypothetical protein
VAGSRPALTSPAASLNAVLGNLAGSGSLKATFKRMVGTWRGIPAKGRGCQASRFWRTSCRRRTLRL